MQDEIVVSVICIAYNQESYIELAIQGMLKQKTKFKFEILINDDCSSDKTADIIKKYQLHYPKLIKAYYQKENLLSRGVFPFQILLQEAKGKYIACCEGDDFWIDDCKLQYQVDFMENNSSYSMCGHSELCCSENGRIIKKKIYHEECLDVIPSMYINTMIFQAASLMFRKSIFSTGIIPGLEKSPYKWLPMIFYFNQKGKIYYQNRFMSVYRNGSKSSIQNMYDSKEKIINMLNEVVGLCNILNMYSNKKYMEDFERYAEKQNVVIYRMTKEKEKIKNLKIYRELSELDRTFLWIKYYCPKILISFYNMIKMKLSLLLKNNNIFNKKFIAQDFDSFIEIMKSYEK